MSKRAHRLFPLASWEEGYCESSEHCACEGWRASAAAKRSQHIRSEDIRDQSRRSRDRCGGGRRSVGSRRAVEIDTSRRVQGSDFRPAKRVDRKRNSESRRVPGR
jgi:hypothetical protein